MQRAAALEKHLPMTEAPTNDRTMKANRNQDARTQKFRRAAKVASSGNRREVLLANGLRRRFQGGDILARQLSAPYRVQDVSVCSTHKE
jgi:hypothetical protein